MTDCPLAVCDGSGWIPTTDFTGDGLDPCVCAFFGPPVEPSPEVRKRLLEEVQRDVEQRAAERGLS